MLIWADGFESDKYLYKKAADGTYVSLTGGDTRTASEFRTGAQSYSIGPNSSSGYYINLGAAAQDDLITVGFAFKYPSSTPIQNISLYNGSAAIRLTRSGNIWSVIRDSDAATLATGSGPTTLGQWYYLEFQARFSGTTTGSVTVKLDETTIINATGIQTLAAIPTQIQIAGTGNSCYIDDVYVTNEQGSVNTGFLGAVKVEAIYPSAAGATTQGVPSSGVNNWDLVNDNPSNTVGYVDLVSTGDQDTYVHTDLPGTYLGTTPVKGVFVWAFGIKTDAGGRNLTSLARLSGTEIAADPAAMVTLNNISGAMVGDAFEAKPGGGGWTVADVNASEFGLRAS